MMAVALHFPIRIAAKPRTYEWDSCPAKVLLRRRLKLFVLFIGGLYFGATRSFRCCESVAIRKNAMGILNSMDIYNPEKHKNPNEST